jgi:hypothetical protein
MNGMGLVQSAPVIHLAADLVGLEDFRKPNPDGFRVELERHGLGLRGGTPGGQEKEDGDDASHGMEAAG